MLSGFGRQLFASLYEELCALEERIAALEKHLERIFQQSETCHRLAAVEGVSPVIATAVIAAIANGRSFHNGRQFAAWVGLMPLQHSSGEKQRLAGITKRGDPYLRILLIHGARSGVYRSHTAEQLAPSCARKVRLEIFPPTGQSKRIPRRVLAIRYMLGSAILHDPGRVPQSPPPIFRQMDPKSRSMATER